METTPVESLLFTNNETQMLMYSGNDIKDHSVGKQYGESYQIVWDLITKKCNFGIFQDKTVERKNDFHLVKNALVYALYKIEGKDDNKIVEALFKGEINIQNLLRRIQATSQDQLNTILELMLDYLTNPATTLNNRPVLHDNERWADFNTAENRNFHNKQHIGRILFHFLNTVNPEFVAEKVETERKLTEFTEKRNKAITKVQSAKDAAELATLTADINWDEETSRIFNKIKETIVSAEKAKDFISKEDLEKLKPLSEEDEKDLAKLDKKQNDVKEVFTRIYDSLLDNKKASIDKLRNKFQTDFPTSIEDIRKSDSSLDYNLKNSKVVDFTGELDDAAKAEIATFISSFDGVATVPQEAIDKVKNEKAHAYIGWFLNAYLEIVAANFNKEKLKTVEDFTVLQIVFPNGDWKKDPKDLAAIILGGDAGSGKGTLGLKTTSSGTEGAAGGGPRHKHLRKITNIWDIARDNGFPNFSLLGSGIFPIQLLGQIDPNTALACDGYPRDPQQAEMFDNPIFPPKSMIFLQTYFPWHPEMPEGKEKTRHEVMVMFRYLVNRYRDGYKRTETGEIEFKGRSDTFAEFFDINDTGTDKAIMAKRAKNKFMQIINGRLATKKFAGGQVEIGFNELHEIAAELYNVGFRLKKDNRMMQFRGNTKAINKKFQGSLNAPIIRIQQVNVAYLNPEQQYGLLVNVCGGVDYLRKNGIEIKDDKYNNGIEQLNALEV